MECSDTCRRALHYSEQSRTIMFTQRQDEGGRIKDGISSSPSSGKLWITLTAAANFASRLRLSSSCAMLSPDKDGMKESSHLTITDITIRGTVVFRDFSSPPLVATYLIRGYRLSPLEVLYTSLLGKALTDLLQRVCVLLMARL